jgi:hypothetical protein
MIDDRWNYDLEEGKKLPLVLIAVASRPALSSPDTPIGYVTSSRWIEKDQRWNFCSKTTKVIAWQPWPEYPTVRRLRARPHKEEEATS